MSYAQRKEISGNRTVAIMIVALIHALLGYAIVTGLAYNVIKKAAEDLKTFDVEEEPPPPEEEPPPPPDKPELPPPPMTPPPIVRVNTPPPPIAIVESPVIPPPRPVVVAPPPPPPPPPPRTVSEPKPARGDVRNMFSADDYPAAAQRDGAEGRTRARLDIGADGRVTGCTIVQSAGHRSLDDVTCRILRRARFTPARDSNGNATSGSYTTPTIVWQLSE